MYDQLQVKCGSLRQEKRIFFRHQPCRRSVSHWTKITFRPAGILYLFLVLDFMKILKFFKFKF